MIITKFLHDISADGVEDSINKTLSKYYSISNLKITPVLLDATSRYDLFLVFNCSPTPNLGNRLCE